MAALETDYALKDCLGIKVSGCRKFVPLPTDAQDPLPRLGFLLGIDLLALIEKPVLAPMACRNIRFQNFPNPARGVLARLGLRCVGLAAPTLEYAMGCSGPLLTEGARRVAFARPY